MSLPASPRPSHPIRLHGFKLSGHCHRVELFLSILNLPVEYVPVDLPGGEHKKPPFLAMNSFGQVPVIDDDGYVLADSNAILVYLAGKYDEGNWLPRDPAGAASVQRWLTVAAGPLAFGPALSRATRLFARQESPDAQTRAHALFQVMDIELGRREFLAGSRPTIADIANYSYVAHAPEGGVMLSDYPNVRAWLGRIEALPGFVAMARSPG